MLPNGVKVEEEGGLTRIGIDSDVVQGAVVSGTRTATTATAASFLRGSGRSEVRWGP